MKYDKKCQLLIIGDSTVGKTSILRRFAQDQFNANYLATIGVDFFTKDIILNEKRIHVKMWDTAGQERYKALTQGFFRNAQGIMIVYDISSKISFNNLKYWIESIENNVKMENKNIPSIIIGNKVDILEREVDIIEGENFAKNKNINYFEVSAKTGQGINEAIKFLIQKVIDINDNNEKEDENIKIKGDDGDNKDKMKKFKNCCNKK